MNTNNRNTSGRPPRILISLALLGALAAFAGCATTGYQKSDLAAWNSQAAARAVQAESRELATTLEALNDLVNQPATDAKPQYLKFSTELDRLVDSTRRAEKEVNRMWSKRAAYFAVWEKEIPTIQDVATRRVSETRKAEVSHQFDAANRGYEEAQHNLQPLIAYLQDIRKALSTDLTRDGLAAIKPPVGQANERTQRVQAALAQSASDLDALSSRTASDRIQDLK
jgi:hypothetical protein